jgi:hypothetical protein
VFEVIDLLYENIVITDLDGDLQIQYSNVGLDFENDESDGLNFVLK